MQTELSEWFDVQAVALKPEIVMILRSKK